MIKVDIVNEVSKIADITKVKAEVAVDAVFDAMRLSMQRGERIELRGFRPMPRLRGFTWKTPNPRSSIRSPRCIESRIASKTASTATSALTLVMSAVFETSLTMSTLIMLTDPLPNGCNYYRE